MNHTTKWNRMTVREHLLDAINYAKETMALAKIKPNHNPPKSVKSVYPEGWSCILGHTL